MMKQLLSVLLLVLFLGGCAYGPEERPGELREKSLAWPSARAIGPEEGPRKPLEQR